MAMTRKHYTAAAEVVKGQRGNVPTLTLISWKHAGNYDPQWDIEDYATGATAMNIAHGLADMFQSDNPRFDRNKFMEACGF